MDQDVAGSRTLLAHVLGALGLTLARARERLAADPPREESELLVDIVLLGASLSRADGDPATAAAAISDVARHIARAGYPLPFQMRFQEGLTSLVAGDHSGAMDRFLLARAAATTDADRIYAIANVVLCLENLGLPYDRALAEWRSLCARLPPGKLAGPRAALDALERRVAFRAGDLRRAIRAGAPEPGTQSDHYRLWAAELPYHRFFRVGSPGGKEAYLFSKRRIYERGYRLRTLEGIVHPDDIARYRDTELADRLYLWTWRWLADPEAFPITRVLALVESVDLAALSTRLTLEDGEMLRNALLWLGLFTPPCLPVARRLARKIAPAGARGYPLLAFERGLVEYAIALVEGRAAHGRAALAFLRRSPLWRSKDVKLVELARALAERRPVRWPPLQGLGERLARRAGLAGAPPPDALIVDPDALRVSRGGASVVSEPLCRALLVLRERRVVACEELALACFGIHRYDAFIHGARVFNLLARLRPLLPAGLRVRTKAGKVYAEGDWEKIVVQGDGAPGSHPAWRALLAQDPALAPAPSSAPTPAALAAAARGKPMTRRELERLLGKSRSSANRLLAEWLASGVIRRVGKARRTRYEVVGAPS